MRLSFNDIALRAQQRRWDALLSAPAKSFSPADAKRIGNALVNASAHRRRLSRHADYLQQDHGGQRAIDAQRRWTAMWARWDGAHQCASI